MSRYFSCRRAIRKVVRSNRIIAVLLFGVTGIIFIKLFSSVVPYNMDEFVFYSNLMCHFSPANDLIRAHSMAVYSCRHYDIDLLGVLRLPLRSFGYIGSFPSIYAYPIFAIWRSPDAARFLGWIFLSIEAVVLSKIFGLRFWQILTGLLSFSIYSYEHIVESGPVGFQILSIFLIYVLSDKWLKTLNLKYLLTIALIIFLGIWIKPTYLWLLPGIFLMCLIRVIERRGYLFKPIYLSKATKQVSIAFIILLAITSALFLSPSSSPEVPSYYEQVISSDSLPINDLINYDWIHGRAVSALFEPTQATWGEFHMILPKILKTYYKYIYFSVPFFLILFLLLNMSGSKINKRHLINSAILYFAFLITIPIVVITKRSWGMHHIILVTPFLILSVLELIVCTKRSKLAKNHNIIVHGVGYLWILFFLLLNLYSYWIFAHQIPREDSDHKSNTVRYILNEEQLAERYAYIILDWGLYYTQGLFGPKNQSVTFLWEPEGDHLLKIVEKEARKQGRKLLFVKNTNTVWNTDTSALVEFLRSRNVRRCNKHPKWMYWQILAEEDPVFDKICATPDS